MIAIFASRAAADSPKIEMLRQDLEARGESVAVCEDVDALLDAAAAMQLRALVAAGGDGTISLLLSLRAQHPQLRPPPLGVLPLGNENLVARALKTPDSPQYLADAIYHRRLIDLDLALAGSQPFLCMCSAGIDADVVHRFDTWRRRGDTIQRATRMKYAAHILRSFFSYPHPRITLHADGQRHSGTWVCVSNLPSYAGGARPCPDATADDGLLDWVVIDNMRGLRGLRHGHNILRGTLRAQKGVVTGRSAEVRIESLAPLQLDGDPLTEQTLTCTLHPDKVQMFDPREI